MNIKIQYYKTPVGELILGEYDNQLCLADWRYRKMRSVIDKRIQSGLKAKYKEQEGTITEQTIQQLNEYFREERTIFDVPILMVGSDFQKQVWRTLVQIPFGKTLSYLALSRQMGNEKAIRAVASANGANAISILVPCHRIIGSNGDLVGYAGGLSAKEKLLQLEGVLNREQLSLF